VFGVHEIAMEMHEYLRTIISAEHGGGNPDNIRKLPIYQCESRDRVGRRLITFYSKPRAKAASFCVNN